MKVRKENVGRVFDVGASSHLEACPRCHSFTVEIEKGMRKGDTYECLLCGLLYKYNKSKIVYMGSMK